MRGRRCLHSLRSHVQKTFNEYCGSSRGNGKSIIRRLCGVLGCYRYVPPNGQGWVDHIRKKGNEANHEIRLMSRRDAEELILLAEMLLKFVYEFPSRVPSGAIGSVNS